MYKKTDIPLWCKKDLLIWVEVRDKSQQEILEFLEAKVSDLDPKTKTLKVIFNNSEEEKEVAGNRIHERLPEHDLIGNLADIPLLNDAELLKHLEVRYKKNFIHCFCGPTLIVVNPYKRVAHEESDETHEVIFNHLKNNTLKKAPPHLWTISAFCYDNLFKSNKNQAICISGESGAGKTESTKRCMAFITGLKVRRRTTGYVPIEDKILSCNPLLEAFGNAKTFRNDNSSRFGKYTVLYLDRTTKKVKGASIENYLLEKSRICNQGKEERNYHIFYALCRFGDKKKLGELKLLDKNGKCDMEQYKFLNQSGIYTSPKIDDKEFYDDVLSSLVALDFKQEQRDSIWKILAIVLHLGNLEIDESKYQEGSKPCTIVKNRHWEAITDLLEIDSDQFEESLTHKEIKVGQSITKSPLSPNKCKNSILSIAKDFYNNLFTWIILKLNSTLLPQKKDHNYGTIGILVIFGFEIFEKNSLEQFFINYANERLQSLYIDYIFKNECAIFEDEGLEEYTALIVYTDNEPICMALDYNKLPPGVFQLIDQACAMNKNDEYLHAEIQKAHRTSQSITFPKFAKKISFIVRHTARDVEYGTHSFVEKNKDEISPFLKNTIKTANKTIVDIYEKTEGLEIIEENNNQRVNPKEKYLGFKFRRDMYSLYQQLIKTNCFFIRCIKPNEFKKADFWNPHLALKQITYMGMLDSLKVRKKSYPFRFKYVKFFEIYQDLDMGESGSKNLRTLVEENEDFQKLSKEIFSNLERKATEKDVLYGNSLIFLQEDYKIWLDQMLLVKQQKKKIALEIISKIYKQYAKDRELKNYFITTSKSILISRDLLKSWTAKLDGLKFKNYIKTIRKLQFKFRFIKERRQQRYKEFNMKVIIRYLSLYKFSQIQTFVLQYKRKVQVMQAMMNRKIKDSKNRYCKSLVNKILNDSWKQIGFCIQKTSAKSIQNSFRSYLLRKQKEKECNLLNQKIGDRQIFDNSSQVQKYIRGYIVRARLEKFNRAASKIQGFFKMKMLVRYFKKIFNAVKVLQKWFRKMYVRQIQINKGMEEFMKENGTYHKSVAILEDRILFGDQEEINELQNMKDYQKMPFFKTGKIDFGKSNYKNFIPKMPGIELKKKVKLMSVMIDIDSHADTTNVYYRTWSKEFLDFLKKIHSKEQRLLSLEIGESFTMAVTGDREVYSWGLNDFNQCARQNFNFNVNQGIVKNLSINKPKILKTGKDHGIMVDEGDNVYVWGRNTEGQLGVNSTKKANCIVVLDNIKGKIRSVDVCGDKSFMLLESGRVLEWPSEQDNQHIFKPQSIPFQNIKIKNLSVGNKFALFLAENGLLYSMGQNNKGELGLGDFDSRKEPTIVNQLKDNNEKVIEISCGFKHVICRTSLQKVYVWGCNRYYQLGLDDKYDRCSPEIAEIHSIKKFRFIPRSIQAGYSSTFMLLEDRNVYFAGQIGSNKRISQNFIKFEYEKKLNANRIIDIYSPIRIQVKWSSLMTVVYLVFADFRNSSISTKNVREKFVSKINHYWNDYYNQLLPPQVDQLYNNIDFKYLQNQNKNSSVVFKYKKQLRQAPKIEMPAGKDNVKSKKSKLGKVKKFGKNKSQYLLNQKQNKSKTPLKKKKKKKMNKSQTIKKTKAIKGKKESNIGIIIGKDLEKLTLAEKKILDLYKQLI